MTDEELLRHSRQILLPHVGVEGQQKLLNSTVLIVGAGGLGCSVAQYLVGSGIGKLVVVDDDVVELSNLPRQIVFEHTDIGAFKANVLCERLNRRLSLGNCQSVVEKFNATLVEALVKENGSEHLLLVDAGDNLSLSYQMDQVATDFQLPLVHASVSRSEGHVYVRLPKKTFPCLSSVFSEQSIAESCSQSGVLTVAVGLLGSYQAMQVVRVLLRPKLGELTPELVLFDGMTMRFMPLSLTSFENSGKKPP